MSDSTVTFTIGDGAQDSEPSTGYEFSGYLHHNDIRVEPYDSWFYTYGGNFSFELEGPSNTDFDMYLQYWDGYEWILIAASLSYSSSESIQYNLPEGYYRILVYSYSGSGNYTLTIQ
jgi:LasA protease